MDKDFHPAESIRESKMTEIVKWIEDSFTGSGKMVVLNKENVRGFIRILRKTAKEKGYRITIRTVNHLNDTAEVTFKAWKEFIPCPRGCGYEGRADYDKGWRTHFDYECPNDPSSEASIQLREAGYTIISTESQQRNADIDAADDDD